jgi:Zn-finger protein
MYNMETRHDLRRPNCPKAEPQKFVSHSNGTIFYKCKNCNYLGAIEAFTAILHVSEISQSH